MEKAIGKGNEDRGGSPSASGFARYFLCNGTFLMEQRHGKDNSSDISRSGDKIHHVLETGKGHENLTPRELDLCRSCEEHTLTAKEMVFKGEEPDGEYKEQRLWSPKKIYSGQSDLTVFRPPRFLVIDYKTGPSPVPHAKDNLQLKALAALTYQNYKKTGCKEVVACIIQPLAGPPTYHLYSEDELKKAVRWASSLVRRITKGEPKLKAGSAQCKYCKAKAVCPALKSEAESLSQVKPLESLTPTQVGDILDRAAAVKGFIKDLEQKAKDMLEADPSSISGYELREGAKRRSIKDSTHAISAILMSGVIDEMEMTRCVKVELGKLESAVSGIGGISLPQARQLVASIIGDKIETSKGASRLCPTE